MTQRLKSFDALFAVLKSYAEERGFVLYKQTYAMKETRAEAIFGIAGRVVQRGYIRCSTKSTNEDNEKCKFAISFTFDFACNEYHLKTDCCWNHNHLIHQTGIVNGIRLVRLENELTPSEMEYLLIILPSLRGA